MTKIQVTDGNVYRPFVYVFVNKGLHMSAGKIAAQVGHAVALSMCSQPTSRLGRWTTSIHRTMIILEADSDEHLRNISKYLAEREFKTHIVIDEGINEIKPFSVTAIASDIVNKNDPRVADAFSSFKLYSDPIKVTLEIPR